MLIDPIEPPAERRTGAFDSELSVQAASFRTWRLTSPLIWTGTQGDTFTVPVGFETDFASSPRFLHWLISPYGAYTRAAVLHDYLYRELIEKGSHAVTGRDADGIFRRVMHDLGVPWIKRWVMWAAVRPHTIFNPRRAYGRQLLPDLPKVIGIWLLAAPFVLPGVVGVLASLALVGIPNALSKLWPAKDRPAG